MDAEQTKQALIDYKLLDNTPRVTRVVKDIIRQTNAGRVETLFVAQDAERWGVFDPETQQVRTHVQSRPGDESLLNLAAVTTLLDRGQVFVLPRSGGAVLQYRISHPATASTNEGIRQR